MSELQQALQEIRAKQPQQKNVELKSALQKIRSQAQAPTEQPQQEGFLKSTARGIAESFGRTAVSGVKAGLGAIELGKLGFGKLTGDVKAEQKFIDRAEDIQQPTNLPFIGETKPVTTPKESVGVGLQVGSFFGGGGVATSAGKALLGGLVRKGASTFAKVGALGGGAIAGGEALEDDESISNVLIKTAIGTATGGIFGGITGGATPLISKAFSKTTSALTKRATQKASQEIDDLIKNIGGATKLSKADIIPLRKAISDVEVRGVDTAQKAVSTFKTRIQALGNKINEVLDTDKRVYSFANLSKQGKNYINEGLEQLQKFYESTNNEQKLNFVKAMRNKLQTQGLTLKEVNIIAQVHGFDLKGFNVLTGELASGLKKQASENTRKGIKNTIQRLFKNPIFSEADSQLSNVLRARDLFTQFAKSVFDKEKKMLDATSVQKFRQVATEAIDVMTGRMMSTILSFSRNRGSNTANALDIEKVLQKMLLKVKRIDNLPPNRIIPRLQSIIDEPAPPALLQLEAPKTIPLPPKPDTSGIITPKKPGGLFEFQEFRKKQFQSIGIQPKKKSNIIESLKKTTPKKTIPKQISKDLATEARKFDTVNEFYERMPSKIRDEFRNKGIKGKEQIEKWWKDNNIPTKKDTLAGAMQHRPSKSGVASNIPQDILPDFYDRPNLYTFGGKEYDESVSILQKIKGKPESTVTIYRASPKNELRTGDWITFSKEKARIESLSENVPVQSFKVKVKDVQFAGDDITEFGYWGNKISDQAKGAK